MLKFKGKVKDFKSYLDEITLKYGKSTTLKEICAMIGALKNVCM